MSEPEDIDPFKPDDGGFQEEEGSPPIPPAKVAGSPEESREVQVESLDAALQPTPPPQPAQPQRLRDDMSKRDAIQIVDALKTTEGSSATYIAYVIRSEHGEARRRYSEFEALRSVLGKLYPVLIIAPIPPHHSLGDYAVKQTKAKEDANVIARRRRMLTVFLNRCNRHPILGQDRTFHRFLDANVTWSEIMHSAPVTQLPKNSLKAPSHDPTDTTLAQLYQSLPNSSSTQPLQDPDPRFRDSEEFTNKFSAHLSGSMERINRRMMKRWSELGADHAELGGLLNGFGLTETTSTVLSSAIERTGTAVDNTYVHTNAMLQEWERSFTEPLAEYGQFSSIIKSLLKFRHNKHLQYEMARDVLETKRINLEDLERTEAEARRLDSALDKASRRVRALDGDSQNETASEPSASPQPMHDTSSTAPPVSRSRSMGSGGGFLGALQHTINSVMDNDPEATRRSSIGKTRDSIGQLEEALRLTTADLRYSSQTIQADLDRFQRQKVGDFKEMCLAFVAFHQEWAEKNLEQWTEAKKEVARLADEI